MNSETFLLADAPTPALNAQNGGRARIVVVVVVFGFETLPES